MNLKANRGVMPIYKESQTITARLNQTMQEWILTFPGNSEAAGARREGDGDLSVAGALDWETLLACNAPLAFRVARGVLRNDADAEDVAQEALLRAYRKLDRLKDRGKFRAWLVRISFRLALDRLRANKRRQEREAQWMMEAARNSASTAGASEFQRQFDKAMEELPEKQRLVMLLAAMEGHTLEEVSTLLAVPMGTVKSRLFFARRTLAEKLRCFVSRTSGN